jgi:hypothetical protein
MKKEFTRTQTCLITNQLKPGQHERWCEFLLWRQGFNLNAPITLHKTGMGVIAEQPDAEVLRLTMRSGVSFLDFCKTRKSFVSETREAIEEMTLFL